LHNGFIICGNLAMMLAQQQLDAYHDQASGAGKKLSASIIGSRKNFDRGRTASYPTAPAQIPACGFPAPGSS